MRVALWVLLSLALASASAVRAAQPEIAALQQEVEALRAIVLDLQERLNRLEGRQPGGTQAAPGTSQAAPPASPAPGANSAYASPEAVLRTNWSKIERETPQSEVTRLLGAPSKVFLLDGRTVWYYYYPGTGSGSVFFTDAGRVSGRQSPFGWGW